LNFFALSHISGSGHQHINLSEFSTSFSKFFCCFAVKNFPSYFSLKQAAIIKFSSSHMCHVKSARSFAASSSSAVVSSLSMIAFRGFHSPESLCSATNATSISVSFM
jgi:hypothetical protein